MKPLSLCTFNKDCKVYKDLNLYESLFIPKGSKCVYLRTEENKQLAQIVFDGTEGIWRAPIDALTHLSAPTIKYKSASGLYTLQLSSESLTLHKEIKNV